MPEQVEATPEGMAKCAVRLDEAAGKIKEIQGAVQTANAQMLATWNGQAATAFERAMLSWNQETSDILTALLWLRDTMAEGGRQYAMTEESMLEAATQLANLNTAGGTRPFFNGG